MKIAILLIFASLSAFGNDLNLPHIWVLKSGNQVAGSYFTSGATSVVVKSSGTNCLLKIADLSTKDWLYFHDCKTAQRERQLDAEAAQLSTGGMMEFNSDLIDNFPEKVNDHDGWMDGKFTGLDSYAAGFLEGGKVSDLDLGFDVEDKSGKMFDHAYVPKEIIGPNFMAGDNSDEHPNELVPVVASLKNGDRIRLIGHVIANPDYQEFEVKRIEMIETAADAASVEKVKEDIGNSQ
jgi:hypothetical protein